MTSLAPIMDAFVALTGAVLTACIPIVTVKVVQVLHLNLSTQQETSLENSLNTAIGKALEYGKTAGDAALSNVTIKNAALSNAAAFVVADAPDALKQLGYTPADIAEIVAARLTKALAETPAVAVVTPDATKTAAMLEKAEAAQAAVVEPVPMAPVPAVA